MIKSSKRQSKKCQLSEKFMLAASGSLTDECVTDELH